MAKVAVLLIVFIIVCGLSSGEIDDRLYKEICTKGFSGYMKFNREYFGNKKIKFWQYFDNLIRNFRYRKEFGNILACSEFWRELKDDELFDYNWDARDDRKEIEAIFANAIGNYKIYLKDSMASLKPLQLEGEYSPEKIKKYTGAKFAGTVQNYAKNYKSILPRVVPEERYDVNTFKSLLNQINQNHPIRSEIKDAVKKYLYLWDEYYGIRDGTTYSRKEAASRKRKEQLERIRKVAGGINTFGINQRLPAIENMIDRAETAEKKWKIHKEVAAVVSGFLDMQNPTLDDLYAAINAIPDIRYVSREEALYNRVQRFKSIPNRRNLSIRWLEDYLTPRKNGKHNIVKVLKQEFGRRLLADLKIKMKAGGESLKDVNAVKSIEDKYKNFFNENTSWQPCISKLENYYNALEKDNYPELLALYDGLLNIKATCFKVVQSWNLIKDKEQVEKKYLGHFRSQTRKVLGDKGDDRYESEFNEYISLYKQTQKYLKIKLKGDWKVRYDKLKEYFDAFDARNRKKLVMAANFLHHDYPKLAKSYSIYRPDLKIVTPPSSKTSNQQELLNFLGMMFTYVKKSRLDDPDFQKICSQLVYSEINGPGYDETIKKYKNKIPRNYDALMNRFFNVIYSREYGWITKARTIIEKGDWGIRIRNKMLQILEEMELLFE